MKEQQRKFLDDQIKEKENRKRKEQDIEQIEAEWIKKVTFMRGVQEKEFLNKKQKNEEETDAFNQREALQKQINYENQKRNIYLEELERKKQLEEMHRERDFVPS